MRYSPEEKVNSLLMKVNAHLNEIVDILSKVFESKTEDKPKSKVKAKPKSKAPKK